MLAAVALASTVLAAPKAVVDPSYDYTQHQDVSIIDLDSQDPDAMNLVMMDDKGLTTKGAVCLDGTSAGFYFAPSKGGDKFKNSWQLYFQGGGWCYDEMDCWGRSKGGLGSSKSWKKTSSMGGIMSADCASNPDYCNFNRVHMAYCDGNSFSGNADMPITVNGEKIYFRGRRIIDAVIETLTEKYNFGAAETVLLTGCSAGGLATYLHTDYVQTQMPKSVTKYGASAISGFFLMHNTVEGNPVYPTEMKYIFGLANSTNGVNADCIAAKAEADKWQCNFAQESYAYTKSPTFPLNSALDSWQTACIYTSELPPAFPNQTGTENGICAAAAGWKKYDPNSCTDEQNTAQNKYIADFESIIQATKTYNAPGNGAFIHSCHTHCEAQSDDWNKFKINGVSMQQVRQAINTVPTHRATLVLSRREHFFKPVRDVSR